MSDPESSLILSAYRPDGQDQDDPAVAEALEHARRDPALNHAFEEQVAFDRSFANALGTIPVPTDLRDRIVAGAKLSSPAAPRPSRTANILRFVLPLAAAAAVIAFLFNVFDPTGRAPAAWQQSSIASLDTYATGEDNPPLLGADADSTASWVSSNLAYPVTLPTALEQRPSRMCRLVENPEDGSIAVICFDAGEGTTLHLTISPHDGTAGDDTPTSPDKSPVEKSGNWEYLAWHDDRYHYLLAASANSAGCCNKLRQVAAVTTP